MVYTLTFSVFALCMMWEMLAPGRKYSGSLIWRWSNNFSLGMLVWYLTAVGTTLLILGVANWTDQHNAGLLPAWNLGTTLEFLILLTLTQLIGYWFHVAFHKVSWLWPIHAVHHSDTEVDVSTSYRHHPLEPLITLPLVVPLVYALGVSLEAAAVFRMFATVVTVFSHSNVRIPRKLESCLRLLVLTPDFHRVHHCSDARYTNSNYGSLVPWFDYLFGTARHREYSEHETMKLGLEYLRDSKDLRIDRLLTQPLAVPGAARLVRKSVPSSEGSLDTGDLSRHA